MGLKKAWKSTGSTKAQMVCTSALVTGHTTNVNYQPMKSTFSILSFKMKKNVTSISKEELGNYRLAGKGSQDREEWLIHLTVMLPPRETLTG